MAEVIPCILSEETARKLPSHFLSQLAECSTRVIQEQIIAYLNNPEADKEVQEKVREAYSIKIATQNFLQSEDTLKKVERIKDLSYSSITPDMSVEELKELRDCIHGILNSPYALPYIAPIKGSIVKDLRDEVAEYGKEQRDSDIKAFAQSLTSFSQLFRDSQHESYKGTVCKNIIRNRGKYEILLRGIGFLLKQKEQGNESSTWRFL